MTPAAARAQIQGGRTQPVYLLEGDDPQLRHDLAVAFADVVDPDLQAFNVDTFRAGEAGSAAQRDQLIGAILTAARTLPMMAPRRVVIVHGAEALLSPRRGSGEEGAPATAEVPRGGGGRARARTPVEEFEAYLEAPEPRTTIVLDAGPLDGSRRLVKLARRRAVVVDCGTLETEADAARWVRARLEQERRAVAPDAVEALVRAVGPRLPRLRAEVEKLVVYAANEPQITAAHVRELVRAHDEPAEGPAVGLAIRDGDARRALAELHALVEAGVVPVAILGQIRWAATQLRPEARVRQALDLVLETDLNLKTSRGEPRHLLERLVVALCKRGQAPV